MIVGRGPVPDRGPLPGACGAAASTAAGRSCAARSPGSSRRCGTSRAARSACPAWELLGGRARDRMRVYGWIGGDRPDDVGRRGRAGARGGPTAVKMNATAELHYLDSEAHVEEAAERLAAARATGRRRRGRLPRPRAPRDGEAARARARAARPLFLEEPVLPEHPEALREIARHTSVPIACGERLYTRWGFKDVLTSGAVDVIQPDLSHAGGLLETRKIAAMAEAFDVAVAPHCPLGPIALAASLQLDACTPNVVIQEQSLRHALQRVRRPARLRARPVGVRRSSTGTSRCRRGRAWAWRSTRSVCGRRRARSLGTARCGATKTGRWLNGEEPGGDRDAVRAGRGARPGRVRRPRGMAAPSPGSTACSWPARPARACCSSTRR